MFDRAEFIVRATCLHEGIPVALLREGRRTKTLARIRQDIATELRKETTLSWAEIGLMVGRGKTYRGRRKKV